MVATAMATTTTATTTITATKSSGLAGPSRRILLMALFLPLQCQIANLDAPSDRVTISTCAVQKPSAISPRLSPSFAEVFSA